MRASGCITLSTILEERKKKIYLKNLPKIQELPSQLQERTFEKVQRLVLRNGLGILLLPYKQFNSFWYKFRYISAVAHDFAHYGRIDGCMFWQRQHE